MAKTRNELQDFVQQIEDLIAGMAHLEDRIKEPSNVAEQKLGEATGRIIPGSEPPQSIRPEQCPIAAHTRFSRTD
jgi:hypothetical protein